MVIIETERLYISEVTLEDAEFIFELMTAPSWIRYIGDRGIETIEDAKNYIREKHIQSYKDLGFGFYKIILKDDNTPLGMCGLIKRKILADVDIGYALLPKYEGMGYAFEAANATLDYAVNTLNFKKVVAITTNDNYRSIHLLEKIGMKYEKNIFYDDGEELLLFSN